MFRKIIMITGVMVLAAAAVFAAPADMPRTGQLTSYGTGSIDDGSLRKGVAWPSPRFTVGTGAEVDCVTDNLTGLMWVKSPDATQRTWQPALDYADGLTLCGHTDWRLPNVNEMESLVNAEEPDSSIWLNTQGFTNVQPVFYWSSTAAVATGGAWGVAISTGSVDAGVNSHLHYVWPVRAGQ